MRIRIIVGIVLLPLLPLVLFFAPDWVLPAVLSFISAMSIWELLGNTGFIPKKRLVVYSLLFAASVPFWSYVSPDVPELSSVFPVAGIAFFIMLLFTEALIDHNRITFTHIGVVFTASLSLPFFFSSLVRIMARADGRHFIMLPFIAALLGDTCAYFIGVLFGKRKLKPDISPKKTVEGAIGGVSGVLLGMAAYGLFEQLAFAHPVNYPLLLLYGALGSVAGILGDLSMSLVKREFHIKDFGNLLPGHGGVLDRFDSLLFAAPVLEVLVTLLPAITVT